MTTRALREFLKVQLIETQRLKEMVGDHPLMSVSFAEREQERTQFRRGPRIDPVRERERKSLALARAEMSRQAETTSHPVRRAQIVTALADLDRRIAAL